MLNKQFFGTFGEVAQSRPNQTDFPRILPVYFVFIQHFLQLKRRQRKEIRRELLNQRKRREIFESGGKSFEWIGQSNQNFD